MKRPRNDPYLNQFEARKILSLETHTRAITPSPNARTAGTRRYNDQTYYASTSEAVQRDERFQQEFIDLTEWNRRYGDTLHERARNMENDEEAVLIEGNVAYVRSQSNPEVSNNGRIYDRFHQVTLLRDRMRGENLYCTCEYFERHKFCKHAILIDRMIE